MMITLVELDHTWIVIIEWQTIMVVVIASSNMDLDVVRLSECNP